MSINLVEKNEKFKHNWDLTDLSVQVCAKCSTDLLKGRKPDCLISSYYSFLSSFPYISFLPVLTSEEGYLKKISFSQQFRVFFHFCAVVLESRVSFLSLTCESYTAQVSCSLNLSGVNKKWSYFFLFEFQEHSLMSHVIFYLDIKSIYVSLLALLKYLRAGRIMDNFIYLFFCLVYVGYTLNSCRTN